jgi:WD40 repeat protein
MQILNGRRHRVESLAFSPCGRWLAAGNRGGLHLWDTANPSPKPKQTDLQTLRHVYDLGFRPDGRLIFANGVIGRVLLKPDEFELQPIGKVPGTGVLSPDGSLLILYRGSLAKKEFDAKGKLRDAAKYNPAASILRSAAFSRDGANLVTVGWQRGKKQLAIRSVDTLKATASVEPVLEADQVVFSHDAAKVVIRSAGSLACYDATNLEAKPRKAVNPSRKHFDAMAVHPEGQLLTTDTEALVKVWDLTTLTVVRTVEWKIGYLYAVVLSPDGARVAVGSHTGKVLVWDWD